MDTEASTKAGARPASAAKITVVFMVVRLLNGLQQTTTHGDQGRSLYMLFHASLHIHIGTR